MEIRIERPPNFEAISKVFPVVLERKGILYCYRPYVYNPDDVEVPEPLMRHEETHNKQQGQSPAYWWSLYLEQPKFRFEQELEAHQVEYKSAIRLIRDKNTQARYLIMAAQRLSGPLYGNSCSYPDAIKLIKKG